MAAWHEGRRFFACTPCSAQAETIGGSAITACWSCGRADPDEWVPPAVARARRMTTHHQEQD